MGRLVEFVVVACVVVVAAVWLGGVGQDDAIEAATDANPAVPGDAQPAAVARVVDGDTAWIRVTQVGGPLAPGDHRVRLLGIDSPEVYTQSGRTECGARDAQAFLRSLLPRGNRVWLEADREDRDRFDRPLRYVWTADGRMTNRSLVALGHARAVLFQPNDRYWDLLRQVEADARDGALGLWACPQR